MWHLIYAEILKFITNISNKDRKLFHYPRVILYLVLGNFLSSIS